MARRTTMNNAITNVMLILLFVLLMQTAYTLNETRQQLKEEQRINAYTVDQFNKMSTKAKQYKDRVEELENANEAMMLHCTPSSIVRAIKATPLPSMKG